MEAYQQEECSTDHKNLESENDILSLLHRGSSENILVDVDIEGLTDNDVDTGEVNTSS